MPLRLRLILAFLLLSVVPLGAVTMYSYVSNRNALRGVAAHEADQLAGELRQRMQVVTAQLSERVEQLMDIPSASEPVVRTSAKAESKPTTKAVVAPNPSPSAESKNTLDTQVADTLGEVAMLLNTVEVQGWRGPGGGGRGGPPPPGGRRGEPPFGPPPAGSEPRGPEAGRRFRPPPGNSAVDVTATRGQPPERPPETATTIPPRAPRLPGTAPSPSPAPAAPTPPDTSADVSDRIKIDLGPMRRELFRQIIPEGTSIADMNPEQRQRLATEVNQRMLGIVEGIRMSAAELQKKADAARRKADADAKIAKAAATDVSQPKPASEPMKRKAALSGSRLDVTLEQNGKVVRAVNAEVNLPQVLLTVFSSMRRGQGEVPFAVGNDGRIYTPTEADRVVVEKLKPTSRPNGTSNVDDWIVVMSADPTGSGLRLGIARPVGDSLKELRRTAGRNAALGLLFIGLAIVGVVPLSGRLTRNLSTLTEAVQRIAHGDFAARVPLKSRDEMGALARAFNQMAADVEAHQRTLVDRERLKRELELGRQIQHDMLPQGPLTLGLTQVAGVSVPAREVGGDFFNYFALPNGHVALLVGDVSGKGVGAALLMANIQASLRTRLGLGQQLSAIADEIDRDVEVNSPGQMYATLFLGILDPATRSLRYINAGHHPQFVLSEQRGIERMAATGLPIGLLAGRGYTERTVNVAAGDLIVFYTDGVVETESETDEMFGTDRFEQLLATCAGRSSEEVLHAVDQALKEFRGTREPFDDATLMAVRVG